MPEPKTPTLLADVATVRRCLIPVGIDAHTRQLAALARIEAALADWELIKNEPVVVGRLAVIKAAHKPKRMMSVGRFPITPVDPDDDRLDRERARKGGE